MHKTFQVVFISLTKRSSIMLPSKSGIFTENLIIIVIINE